jgi:hypothetical protein
MHSHVLLTNPRLCEVRTEHTVCAALAVVAVLLLLLLLLLLLSAYSDSAWPMPSFRRLANIQSNRREIKREVSRDGIAEGTLTGILASPVAPLDLSPLLEASIGNGSLLGKQLPGTATNTGQPWPLARHWSREHSRVPDQAMTA